MTRFWNCAIIEIVTRKLNNGEQKMKHDIPMIDGDEVDAFSKRHGHLAWKPGERKQIKRKFNKRSRRKQKEELNAKI